MKVAAVKNDKQVFVEVFGQLLIFRDFAESFTNYKNLFRYGNGDEVLGNFPPSPVINPPLPPLPVVTANCQKRFAELIQDCVKSSNYTVAIGEDLGIEAPVTPFNPADGQPVIKKLYSTGGLPGFSWKKGKYQGIEVWINTGAGWKYLDKDFNPDFVDKQTPLPPAGTSAVWKYKAIYLFKGEQAGQWSEELSITVYGAV